MEGVRDVLARKIVSKNVAARGEPEERGSISDTRHLEVFIGVKKKPCYGEQKHIDYRHVFDITTFHQ